MVFVSKDKDRKAIVRIQGATSYLTLLRFDGRWYRDPVSVPLPSLGLAIDEALSHVKGKDNL